MKNAIEILLSDTRGIYIPRDFISCYNIADWSIELSEYQREALSSPDSGGYWDTWTFILDNAKHIASDGNVFCLYQDGDLFAVCYDRMTDKEYEDFFSEERD